MAYLSQDHKLLWSNGRIELRRGDITTIEVDAIVNAANSQLKGGGGVNGAIQRAAGPALLQTCRKDFKDGCPPGRAIVTPSFQLKTCKHIIHAVGPDCRRTPPPQRPTAEQVRQLQSCYTWSLSLAAAFNATSIAFPTISTGIYEFPAAEAARAALTAVHAFLAEPRGRKIERIVFLVYGPGTPDEPEYLMLLPQFFPVTSSEFWGRAAYSTPGVPTTPSPREATVSSSAPAQFRQRPTPRQAAPSPPSPPRQATRRPAATVANGGKGKAKGGGKRGKKNDSEWAKRMVEAKRAKARARREAPDASPAKVSRPVSRKEVVALGGRSALSKTRGPPGKQLRSGRVVD